MRPPFPLVSSVSAPKHVPFRPQFRRLRDETTVEESPQEESGYSKSAEYHALVKHPEDLRFIRSTFYISPSIRDRQKYLDRLSRYDIKILDTYYGSSMFHTVANVR